MFGRNEIHGKKSFRGREELLVTSIFYTLQGEGPFSGKPAVFVRLAHCNLACSFCDTYFDHGEWLDIHAVTTRAIDLVPPNILASRDCILVITGGEPGLQTKALHNFFLLSALRFRKVQIETNGIVNMTDDLPASVCVVVSPKCGPGGKYIKPGKSMLEWASALKFVVSGDYKSPYYDIPQWVTDWRDQNPRADVFVSPMNEYLREPAIDETSSIWAPLLVDMKKAERNHRHAAMLCLERGFRLSLQTHLYVGLP